jgi:DNA modification methylase
MFLGNWKLNDVSCASVINFLGSVPSNSIHCVTTSPPYWGQRVYSDQHKEELGREKTVQEYIARMATIFEEIRRVLRPDGICWLNLGDTFAADRRSYSHRDQKRGDVGNPGTLNIPPGFKPKDKMLIPHRIAIALQDAGWWVRMDNVWSKANGMPSSAQDRPTDTHEYVFMLTKSEHYWYDQDVTREPHTEVSKKRAMRGRSDHGKYIDGNKLTGTAQSLSKNGAVNRGYTHMEEAIANGETDLHPLGRNRGSVWTLATSSLRYDFCLNCQNFYDGGIKPSRYETVMVKGKVVEKAIKTCPMCACEDQWIDHFAPYPMDLIKPLIDSSCPSKTCACCGNPWKREKIKEGKKSWGTKRNKRAGAAGSEVTSASVFNTGESHQCFLGELVPACQCNAPTVPGIVFDPFMGSGTTALVARQLDRRFIGCDLSPQYVALAKARLREPLFEVAQTVAPEPAVLPQQMELV